MKKKKERDMYDFVLDNSPYIICGGTIIVCIIKLAVCLCTEEICDIKDSHVHPYISEDGYVSYTGHRWKNINFLNFVNKDIDCIMVSPNELELYEFLELNYLVNIKDNLEVIEKIQTEKNKIYKYQYEYVSNLPMIKKVNLWTDNPSNHNLTGKVRVKKYMYRGCNVVKNEEGNYDIVYSEYVNDIKELVDTYTYIEKNNFFKEVYREVDMTDEIRPVLSQNNLQKKLVKSI